MFFMFISIVSIVYISLNYLLFKRIYACLPPINIVKNIFVVVFLLLASSFIIFHLTNGLEIRILSKITNYIGSYYLAFALYFLLFILIIDLIRIINHFIDIYPHFIKNNYQTTKYILATSVFIFTTIIVIYGSVNAKNPVVKELNLNIDKMAGNINKLKLVMVSDVHLGEMNGYNFAENLVKKINKQNPDIVIFAGDLIDEDVKPLISVRL